MLRVPCLPSEALYGSAVTPGFGARDTWLKLPGNNLGAGPAFFTAPFSYLGNADVNSAGSQSTGMRMNLMSSLSAAAWHVSSTGFLGRWCPSSRVSTVLMLGSRLLTVSTGFVCSPTAPLSSVCCLHDHRASTVCQESRLGFARCCGSAGKATSECSVADLFTLCCFS